MIFLSELKGKPIWDAGGERIGACLDLLIAGLDRPLPVVKTLAVKDGKGNARFIKADQVGWLWPSILLKVNSSELEPCEPAADELRLGEQLLDRQIVDAEGRRVVRVNDIQIARVGDAFCVIGVDVGLAGLLRRLGLEGATKSVLSVFKTAAPEAIIPWEDVAPLQTQEPLRLRISGEKIGKLHPADIASIVSDLDRHTGQALIQSFDDETLADAMEEISEDMQVAVLSQMEPERAADILEEMAPDEAADLVADLPAETSGRILGLMEDEDSEDVKQLLAYPEDSAGGVMTTEFATLREGLTAQEALEQLRHSEEAQEDEHLFFIYIVDDQGILKGVISLRDLVLAAPGKPLAEFMDTDPITVGPQMPQQEVAQLVAKYDLLAMPVVNESKTLLGIVTVDDAVDAILPTAWKKRLPRFF
jgi:CBS domain-containing protein/sporulation protein YlmC with PRC-barrel domain